MVAGGIAPRIPPATPSPASSCPRSSTTRSGASSRSRSHRDDRTKIEVLASDHGLSRKFLAQVLVEAAQRRHRLQPTAAPTAATDSARSPAEIRIIDVFAALFARVSTVTGTWVNGSRAAAVTHIAWDQIGDAIGGVLRG